MEIDLLQLWYDGPKNLEAEDQAPKADDGPENLEATDQAPEEHAKGVANVSGDTITEADSTDGEDTDEDGGDGDSDESSTLP